jgi:lysophospholipase L1-like esterase
MSEKLGRTIGIIKHSSHGTSLDTVWSPATPDSLYWEFVRKVEAARKVRPIEIVGLIMVQGSGDSKEQKKAEAYAANLQAWMQAVRKDLPAPNLLVVCSRLRAGQPKDKFPFAPLVRQAQENGSEYVDCDALEVGDDEVHFTAKGQIDLGRLFADKLNGMMIKAEGQR